MEVPSSLQTKGLTMAGLEGVAEVGEVEEEEEWELEATTAALC